MFDDLFCATALATVGAVLAAGVWAGASELSAPVQASATPVVPVAVVSPESVKPKAALPVFDLPRVVINGNRSREGDLMAGELPAPSGRAGGQ